MMQQTETLHSELTISMHQQRHLISKFQGNVSNSQILLMMLFDYTQSNLYLAATPYILRPVIKVPWLFSVKYCKQNPYKPATSIKRQRPYFGCPDEGFATVSQNFKTWICTEKALIDKSLNKRRWLINTFQDTFIMIVKPDWSCLAKQATELWLNH